MKGLFPEYDDHTTEEFRDAWNSGLFVFDTSVLLNLYKYQVKTRDELLNVLGQLSTRIWVPHHVALEFQRNRLKVVADQNLRFSDVRRAIEKAQLSLSSDLDKLQLQKRHSLIDPEPLVTGLKKLADEFLLKLEELRKSQQPINQPDPLREKIQTLFHCRVGRTPQNQAEIDGVYKEADVRYKSKIPPGYQDSEKDKDSPDEHLHGGIIYKRKFGDYLVWVQMIAHAKEAGMKKLIFVTDDGKEDWWRKIDSDGVKTVGPRPELIGEAKHKGLVDTFLMYSPEGFLKYAKEFVQAQVSNETLDEVREVSVTKSISDEEPRHAPAGRVQRAVFKFLKSQFEEVAENRIGFPDLVAKRGVARVGIEVQMIADRWDDVPRLLIGAMRHAVDETKDRRFDELLLVLVVQESHAVDLVNWRVESFAANIPDNLKVMIGVYDPVRDNFVARDFS
jgi:hypothetical protein